MASDGTNQSGLYTQGYGQLPNQYRDRSAEQTTGNNTMIPQFNSQYAWDPTQNPNLGRYQPPTLTNPMTGADSWANNGGYSYNLPNSFGQYNGTTGGQSYAAMMQQFQQQQTPPQSGGPAPTSQPPVNYNNGNPGTPATYNPPMSFNNGNPGTPATYNAGGAPVPQLPPGMLSSYQRGFAPTAGAGGMLGPNTNALAGMRQAMGVYNGQPVSGGLAQQPMNRQGMGLYTNTLGSLMGGRTPVPSFIGPNGGQIQQPYNRY